MIQNRFWQLLAKKFAGEATAEELAELQLLMKENPELHFPAQHLEDLWKLKLPNDEKASEQAFQSHLNYLHTKGARLPRFGEVPIRIKSHLTKKGRMLLFAGFGGMVLGLVVVLSWYVGGRRSTGPEKERPSSEIVTQPGSRTKLVLPDGSTVWLNSGSRLSYGQHFGSTNRELTLNGEAYFDVRKSSMPFIIHAHGIQIRVLGTAFNVKSYSGEKTTETSLIRGKVEVTIDRRPDVKYVLAPNEKLVVPTALAEASKESQEKNDLPVLYHALKHQNDSTILETSWVDNKLIFDNEPFEEIARKMERWYGITIEFSDPEIKDTRLTGTFTNETIEQALQELEYSASFHFESKNNKITIMK